VCAWFQIGPCVEGRERKGGDVDRATLGEKGRRKEARRVGLGGSLLSSSRGEDLLFPSCLSLGEVESDELRRGGRQRKEGQVLVLRDVFL